MRPRVVAALLVMPLVALALAATTATAAPDPDLTVTAARILRTTPVAVSSLNLVPVTVEVDAKYTRPDANPDTTLFAILERSAGSGQLNHFYTTPLKRYEGTTQDGKWRGIVNVPSSANGKFELTGVMHGRFWWDDDFELTPVPGTRPVLTVVGSNLPKITARVIPDPVPFGQGYAIRWSVINSQTAKPYGTRLKVALQNDTGCVESFGGSNALTDTNGNVTKTYPASIAMNCLLLPGDPSTSGGLSIHINRPGIVSATPSKTSAPVGSIVPVNGVVMGAPDGCPVHLQRLYGATAWRNVGTANVRQLSGKFVLSAQPAYKGYIPYRVSFPACKHFRAGLSKTFTIRGI
ncbi:hypothetical protein GCM10029976_059940 [Kribbella albertanoniae]|uniref:Carboxypeptidase regulatory-like domain-containing protein n=1 Tax=Kribbella albertanoniae TaxID=1266829 RepID=A0A4R4QI33_9ACTN|nr:hypothetical protein [Kribbella albertanoniae]TDC34872.1 hypothetical protein E1261_02940 [Kribbella albertanoniae]